MHLDPMAMARTIREDQIVIRISRPLQAELEAAAVADGGGLSSIVRRVLVAWATQRVVERSPRDSEAA
jgi:acyl dehydratase